MLKRVLGDFNPKSVISSGYQLLQTNPYREGSLRRQILPSTFSQLLPPPFNTSYKRISCSHYRLDWRGVGQGRLLYWCGFYGGSTNSPTPQIKIWIFYIMRLWALDFLAEFFIGQVFRFPFLVFYISYPFTVVIACDYGTLYKLLFQ